MPSATGWSANSRSGLQAAGLDDPVGMRRASGELLSLALIDSRNTLLERLAQDESAPALRLALRAGWYADHWIGRHVQRQRGEACDAAAPRLAGIEPRADGWRAGSTEGLTPEALRHYLAETLEITLDLLAGIAPAAESDAALHFYRCALLHEDRLGEALAERLNRGAPDAQAERPPLLLPAQTWPLGSPDAGEGRGLVPYNERWAHAVAVPEFEIDAQPVNWARYVEFADDGGYDRRELWTEAGWAWVQAQGRRAPAGVEQLQGAVLVQRGQGEQAALARAAMGQPVLHVTRHEAEAWCRWAGRRLPTEPEWELAASAGVRRGFAWGEVFEWVAGSARAWPGAGPVPPGCLDAPPSPAPATAASTAAAAVAVAASGVFGVLRGGSFATRRRWLHPKARRFARIDQDTIPCGFRSCTL